MAGGQAEPPKGMVLDISAHCQICFESVDEAEYFPIEKILKWKCSKAHISFIEEFKL